MDVDDLNLVLSQWEMPCSGIGGQQQEIMTSGFGSELVSDSALPPDLQMVGFASWAEYREYLLSLTPSESVLHAYDLIDVHNATCEDDHNEE